MTAKKNKGIPKEIVEKAKELEKMRTQYYITDRKIEELTRDLREYVQKNGRKNQKGYLAVWNKIVEIHLEPNPKIEIYPYRLFKLIGQPAFLFYSVLKGKLDTARKEGTIGLDDAQIKKISKKSDGTPRVKVEIKEKKDLGSKGKSVEEMLDEAFEEDGCKSIPIRPKK